MKDFENILIENGWKKHIENSENSSLIFEDIEKMIGFKLPDDYSEYVQNFYGGENFIGNEYIILWDLNDLVEYNQDYEIIQNLKNIIGIGGNGGGEFIGIEYLKDSEYRIVLCPLIGMNEKDFMEIGSSFSDFLMRLQLGKNWFK
ncbi:hypothetical protein HNP38_001383 [Chryseobacterium defluvii]|uniref:Knr4/Smi1-like domain-containing protein n=1 Tax=Chryseobacterium defluvii TaxID=160396 RepID=A0A840K9I0_9FLAO|nr:SMI1/KNR4 family protein [Chryseobacterium defluvii]MBB4806111.1 hypothetical protein [Chryseobacterium defluvii]